MNSTARPAERGERWFTALYSAHYAHVVRYALRRLADLDAATDLAQQAFMAAWRGRVEGPDGGLPWLYGVARRFLANHGRSPGARPPPLLTGEAWTYDVV